MIGSESQEIFALLSSAAKFEVACDGSFIRRNVTTLILTEIDVIRELNRGEFYEIRSR